MASTNNFKRQRGFSLIEGLFSALILAIALLGLAGFHAAALQDGSLVKARSVAANLAQEKLDDLRGFTRLLDNPTTTTVDECAAPTFCFSEIAANAGGREIGGGTSLVLPAGAVSGYTDSYTLGWTVTCAPEAAGSALSFSATCNAATVAKLVTVMLTWTDSKGAAQSTSLQGVIYALDPSKMALATATSFSTQAPKAGYTPIGVPDAVPVPINTGTGEYKESSKPVPDIVSNGAGAEVSFDAVSYVSDGAGGFETTTQEEFSTVACECAFNGSATAYSPSRTIWNGSGLVTQIGDQITKPVGSAANGQSDLCTACCRDHHDVSDSTQAKYDPDRPSTEYEVGGNHKHYWYANCVAGTLGQTSGCNSSDKDPANGYSVVDSGAYLESCRFKRVDGFWRLWQDWRLVKMTVMPSKYLETPANLDDYVNHIEAVVDNTVRVDSNNGSTTIPALANRDITFTANGETEQLLGRAIYVDRIYEEDDPSTLDATYYSEVVALIDASEDWLNIVPFYEANLTLLIDWASSDTSNATVSSAPIVNINNVSSGYYDSFSRGLVTAVSGGSATIAATTRLHNSGVTGGINTSSPSYGISAYDNTGPLSDSITVTVPNAPSSAGISGKFIRANVSVVFSTLQVTGATCTLLTAIGNELPYSCTVTSGSSPTLNYASSATGYRFDPTSNAYSNVTSAITGQTITVYGPTVQISGSVTTSGGGKLTSVSATSGTCTIAPGGKSYSCSVPNSALGYSGTVTFTGDNPSPSVYLYAGQQADAVLNVTVAK
jgi:type II secretory pathway pseudopilin PulG